MKLVMGFSSVLGIDKRM